MIVFVPKKKKKKDDGVINMYNLCITNYYKSPWA